MASNGSSKASGTCVRCPRQTMNRCTGCLEAPVYNECFSEPTFYCGPVCQKADWSQHKSKCKKLQARKFIHRATLLLQAIIYRIRLHASPLQFKSVHLEGSTVLLEGYQLTFSEQMLKAFPISLDDDRGVAEAVLVYMGCMEAMLYLHDFAQELLTELCSKIEEVNVNVFKRKLDISLVLPDGHRLAPPDSFFHNLYRVTLKSGEVWAIDTTGAQYGYPNPCDPWPDFEQRRSCKVIRECDFGYIRRQVWQDYGMFPMKYMVTQKIEKLELAEALEEKIPTLAQGHGGKLNAILRGSDAAFKEAKDRFLDQLDDHLKASMAKLYEPDQTARRNKEIERQLSQNMADPDKKKSLNDFLRFVASAIGTPKVLA